MNAAVVRETAVANPWIWATTGFVFSLFAALIALFGLATPIPQAALVVVGMFLVGIGITLRLNSSAPAFGTRLPVPTAMVYVVLTLFQVLGALLTTWCLIAALFGFDPFVPMRSTQEFPAPLHAGLGLVLWFMVVPMAISGMRITWHGLTNLGEWNVKLETSALFLLATLTTLASGFALAPIATSLSFFLGVLTALLAALVSFALVSQTMQRVVFSAAIILHFGAIINATLAANPSSWLLGQMWTRFSRPYLEFMYLNNAYHFYSPEPGPASYLWFRLFYDTGEVDPETKEKKLVARWVKIPDIDENGNHQYRVALEYQRYLSLTEQVVASEPPPPLYYRTPDGRMNWTPLYASRIINSPDGDILKREWKNEVVGEKRAELPKFVLSVPFHQFVPNDAQYSKPTLAAHRMIETYVRHVAQKPHPTSPYPLHSVKVYRVTHMIPPWNVYMAEMDPADPEFYRPYYMGEYLPNGELKDADEPLRYWLLPILRDNSSLPHSPIRNYAAMHAGDPLSVYLPAEKKWTEPKKEGPR